MDLPLEQVNLKPTWPETSAEAQPSARPTAEVPSFESTAAHNIPPLLTQPEPVTCGLSTEPAGRARAGGQFPLGRSPPCERREPWSANQGAVGPPGGYAPHRLRTLTTTESRSQRSKWVSSPNRSET